MCIHSVSGDYGVTRNGNPYKKSNMGKRIGRDVALGCVAYNSVKMVRSGQLTSIISKTLNSLYQLGGSAANFATKNPKLLKWGMFGTGVALAAVIAGGIGKLAGHIVDKVVESRRKKAADKAAEA